MEQNKVNKIIEGLERNLSANNISAKEKNELLINSLGLDTFHQFADAIAKKNITELAPPFTSYESYEGDIIAYLTIFLHKYEDYFMSSVGSNIDNINLYMQAFIKGAREQMSLPALPVHFDIQAEIHDVCGMIINTLAMYYNGFPACAYEVMEKTMTKTNCHLMELLPQLLCYNSCNMYRVRKKDHHDIKDLFHVPFDKRELCASYRFSIAGVPALYCGASLKTSILETRIPQNTEFSATIFRFNEKQQNITFVDLALPFGRNLTFWEEYSLVVFYPLIVACGLKVRKPGTPFKPEYIIPQIFYQVIRNHSEAFCGISYTSTRYDHPDFTDYKQRNFVVFVQNAELEEGYDTDLASCMEAAQPQIFTYTSDEDIKKQEAALRQVPLEPFSC